MQSVRERKRELKDGIVRSDKEHGRSRTSESRATVLMDWSSLANYGIAGAMLVIGFMLSMWFLKHIIKPWADQRIESERKQAELRLKIEQQRADDSSALTQEVMKTMQTMRIGVSDLRSTLDTFHSESKNEYAKYSAWPVTLILLTMSEAAMAMCQQLNFDYTPYHGRVKDFVEKHRHESDK